VGKFDYDDDEEEHYVDADDETVVENKDVSSPPQLEEEDDENSQADDNINSTWIHRNNAQIRQTGKGYDPMSRNPMYARAELSGGFWELQLLAEHNHPSVFIIQKVVHFRGFQCLFLSTW
jgi:ribosome biogenesis protein MAK21